MVTQESTLEPSIGKIKRSSKYCHLNGFENNTFRHLNGRSNVVSIEKCQSLMDVWPDTKVNDYDHVSVFNIHFIFC